MKNKTLIALAVGTILTGCGSSSDSEVLMNVRLMETTDLHSNMKPYNYFVSEPENAVNPQPYGLSRTAVLIHEARSEVENSMLFDNGDLIQGSPMGDYLANLGVEHLKKQLHPVYKAMNYLGYDAGNIGNHEFNYGLDYLAAATAGANFPYINSNVYEFSKFTSASYDQENCQIDIEDHFAGNYEAFFDKAEPFFTPFEILARDFTAEDGNTYTVNVGVIGFTPPQILDWDKRHLECKVLLADIKMTAEYYVPKMKEAGADVIVAIPHSGLTGGDLTSDFMENATWQLAQVAGIDALMFGHDHNNFPTESNVYDGMPGVDAANGKIFGKPAVMPGFWGNHLGVIDLQLSSSDKGQTWSVASSTAELRELKSDPNEQDYVINSLVQNDHDGTVAFMGEEIARIVEPINSFFSAVEPDTSVQIVNEAQQDKGQAWKDQGILENDYPVLSVSAPFKGGRGGSGDYTNIDSDALTRASVADLYVFDNNTPAVLELSAGAIIEWLEVVASQQYKTVAAEGDYLLHQQFRSYNYDVFFGGFDAQGNSLLNYEIDVSVGPRYAVNDLGELIYDNGELVINPANQRIRNFTFNGQVYSLDSEERFYVVTNNYRASQKDMPGVSESVTVHTDEAYTNRELVNDYLNKLVDEQNTAGDEEVILEFTNAHNFSLAATPGLTVKFLSSHSDSAVDFANQYLNNVTPTAEFGNVGDNSGYRVFEYSFK
ncbi:bifunctional 2',3'-cyclic-nucleotide 2'-phosphodiesterase/3'-nucleotidase [Vibrio sp. CAU 1672]|uniref:bifunctional 2',3'-cyclic-nucleotide 2'-phosphodiesterase/3'-nucleotidase n=1 Tax=Vibrio sp. CAU 1672 TaxID=3032594 RepID=UPI0023DC0F93|nr:bifunctional 2',3'-cyclic-nucleotide 2'-phosphodiesterase/3'-nucleotidase [Vibrio sp. CAU 1672]MDF2152701.1 bifunctional 2',3'-cyclic-nucleotide 2'-phosphodiesterase/3'-nucleotidase [Vibrio sp. CAU 1672]